MNKINDLLRKALEIALHDNNVDAFTEEEQEMLRNWISIQRLTHCPHCESKENQDYCSFTEKTQCKQCSCVYGSYGGEVYF